MKLNLIEIVENNKQILEEVYKQTLTNYDYTAIYVRYLVRHMVVHEKTIQ